MSEKLEEKYFDVLQNMEFAIVNVYHKHPDLTDYDVEKVLNALVREYQSQQKGREFARPALKPVAEDVYVGVKQMCEWRLGHQKLTGNKPRTNNPSPEPISVDEVIICLKRIIKSVGTWNKRGGQQGYLQYVDQFIK